MGNLPASISGSTPSITTRRCVPTVRLIKMAGVSNNPSSKCGMSGKMAGLAGGMRESGFGPLNDYTYDRIPVSRRSFWFCRAVHRGAALSLPIGYPNVFHLRGVLQKPAAFALFNIEPIDSPALIAEDLLEVSRRRSLRNHSIGLARKGPDGVHIIVLGQNLQQFAAVSRNYVHNAAWQVTRFKNLIQITHDKRISFRGNRNYAVAHCNGRHDQRQKSEQRNFGGADDPYGSDWLVHRQRDAAERWIMHRAIVFVRPGRIGKN